MRPSLLPSALLAFPLLATDAPAQQLQLLLQAGDVLGPGVQIEDSSASSPFHFAQVNDTGEWIVRAVLESSTDQAVVRSGALALKTGDVAPGVGGTIASFRGLHINDAGNVVWALRLASGPAAEAVVVDSTLVARDGDVPLGATWPVGSAYATFYDVAINDAATKLALRGYTTTPTSVPCCVDEFAGLWTLDAAHNIVGEQVLMREGTTPVGYAAGTVILTPSGVDKVNLNEAGHMLLGASLLGTVGGGTDNSAIWLNTTGTAAGNVLLAKEGTLEPGSGMTWGDLIGPEFTINDAGDYAFYGRFLGGFFGIYVIYRNGSVFAMDGGTHPAFPGRTFEHFGDGPIRLDDAGQLFWYVNFTGSSSGDAGLFLEQELLVREGQTVGGIGTITEIEGLEGDMDGSGNGRYLIFEAEVDGVKSILLYDRLGQFEFTCDGDGGSPPGCTSCPCGNDIGAGLTGGCRNSVGTGASLQPSGNPSATADSLRFEAAGATLNSFGVLISANNSLPQTGACPPGSGISSLALDGLRCVGGGVLRHGARPTSATGTIGVTTNGWGPPNGPAGGLVTASGLVPGQTRRFQLFYREMPTVGCLSGQNTSNAVAVVALP